MNLTILAFFSSLVVYGLSSLALPRPDLDAYDDITDMSAEIGDESPSDTMTETDHGNGAVNLG